jgi:hypothetical protein
MNLLSPPLPTALSPLLMAGLSELKVVFSTTNQRLLYRKMPQTSFVSCIALFF